jgi:hypothetical protein
MNLFSGLEKGDGYDVRYRWFERRMICCKCSFRTERFASFYIQFIDNFIQCSAFFVLDDCELFNGFSVFRTQITSPYPLYDSIRSYLVDYQSITVIISLKLYLLRAVQTHSSTSYFSSIVCESPTQQDNAKPHTTAKINTYKFSRKYDSLLSTCQTPHMSIKNLDTHIKFYILL